MIIIKDSNVIKKDVNFKNSGINQVHTTLDNTAYYKLWTSQRSVSFIKNLKFNFNDNKNKIF